MARDAKLPLDRNSVGIQVLGPGNYSAGFAVTAASARAALPTGCVGGDVVRIASTQDCYIKFGTVSTDAATTDILFLAGAEFMTVPNLATHLAAIRVGSDGVVQVTKMV
jgi:hypothetical protein